MFLISVAIISNHMQDRFNIRLPNTSGKIKLPHFSLSTMLDSSALWACFVRISPLVVFICCAMCFNAVFFTRSEFQETSGSLFWVPGTRSCIVIDWETLIFPLSLIHLFFPSLSFYLIYSSSSNSLVTVICKNQSRFASCTIKHELLLR